MFFRMYDLDNPSVVDYILIKWTWKSNGKETRARKISYIYIEYMVWECETISDINIFFLTLLLTVWTAHAEDHRKNEDSGGKPLNISTQRFLWKETFFQLHGWVIQHLMSWDLD